MRSRKKKSRGYTFVEVLVVTAIIGITATIAIVSLNKAHAKGKDGVAITAINRLRARAEIIYALDRDYDKVKCSGGDKEIADLCLSINAKLSPNTLNIVPSADTNAGRYCAYIKLLSPKNGTANYYCIDSSGTAKETTTDPGGASGKCKSSGTFVCP